MDEKKWDIFDLIPPDEGSINQYYGRIGSGKTLIATNDLVHCLNRGQICYANWKINWQGYDQRKKWIYRLLGALGLKKYYWYFPPENFRYLPVDSHFHETLARLTDCIIFLDEGHIAFDSYVLTKMKIQDRAAVLHTRHFNRTINIISQRPSAIHVTLRGNVNRFYKCEKVFEFWKIKIMKKSEFQDLDSSERPDETQEPISSATYIGRKKYYQMYDSKYMRGDAFSSQPNLAQLIHIPYLQRLRNLFKLKK